jgi:hypothetical protein
MCIKTSVAFKCKFNIVLQLFMHIYIKTIEHTLLIIISVTKILININSVYI